MPDYCVSKAALDSGEHLVHRLDKSCPLIPDEDRRHDFASLAGDDDAMSTAARQFEHVDGCPECMPDRNDHVTRQAVDASIAALITISNM